MTFKTLILGLTLCLAMCVAFALLTNIAHAADKDPGKGGGDKELSTKKGMDSLATKEFDKSRLPGKMEFGIVIGSFIAMMAVFKYL